MLYLLGLGASKKISQIPYYCRACRDITDHRLEKQGLEVSCYFVIGGEVDQIWNVTCLECDNSKDLSDEQREALLELVENLEDMDQKEFLRHLKMIEMNM